MMKRFVNTKMMTTYLIKFAIRITIFVLIAILYVVDKPLMYQLMQQPVWMGLTPIHILWLVFMGMMLLHIFTIKKKMTMASVYSI